MIQAGRERGFIKKQAKMELGTEEKMEDNSMLLPEIEIPESNESLLGVVSNQNNGICFRKCRCM